MTDTIGILLKARTAIEAEISHDFWEWAKTHPNQEFYGVEPRAWIIADIDNALRDLGYVPFSKEHIEEA